MLDTKPNDDPGFLYLFANDIFEYGLWHRPASIDIGVRPVPGEVVAVVINDEPQFILDDDNKPENDNEAFINLRLSSDGIDGEALGYSLTCSKEQRLQIASNTGRIDGELTFGPNADIQANLTVDGFTVDWKPLEQARFGFRQDGVLYSPTITGELNRHEASADVFKPVTYLQSGVPVGVHNRLEVSVPFFKRTLGMEDETKSRITERQQ